MDYISEAEIVRGRRREGMAVDREQRAYNAGAEKAAEAERAKVVAWLRAQASHGDDLDYAGIAFAADAIASLAHHTEDKA